jgi:hypothetical protein
MEKAIERQMISGVGENREEYELLNGCSYLPSWQNRPIGGRRKTPGEEFERQEHGLNRASITGIGRSNAHRDSVFSEKTWKEHRKAAGNENPDIHQGGAGQDGAEDSQKFQGDHI